MQIQNVIKYYITFYFFPLNMINNYISSISEQFHITHDEAILAPRNDD